MSKLLLKSFWIVFTKEVMDALRDRRTLLRLLVPAVLMGPLLLLALSALISSLEDRAEKREVLVVGIEHAPSLRNFLERQTYTVKAAPADYEARLRATTLLEPVMVIGKDFEEALRAGERPTVEVVSDSANQRAAAKMWEKRVAARAVLVGALGRRASVALAVAGRVAAHAVDAMTTSALDAGITRFPVCREADPECVARRCIRAGVRVGRARDRHALTVVVATSTGAVAG